MLVKPTFFRFRNNTVMTHDKAKRASKYDTDIGTKERYQELAQLFSHTLLLLQNSNRTMVKQILIKNGILAVGYLKI